MHVGRSALCIRSINHMSFCCHDLLQDKGLRAAVVYRFGTVVFFHMNKLDEQHWVDRLRECTSEPLSEPVTDGE